MYDGKLISLRKEVMQPLLKQPKIPKLFFIDACRGNDELISKVGDLSNGDAPKSMKDYEEGFREIEVNFCIDYATIPYHYSYASDYESKWMPHRQQCKTLD